MLHIIINRPIMLNFPPFVRTILFIQKAGRKGSRDYRMWCRTHIELWYKVTHGKANWVIWDSFFCALELHQQYNWLIRWHFNWEKLWAITIGTNRFIRFWNRRDLSRLVLLGHLFQYNRTLVKVWKARLSWKYGQFSASSLCVTEIGDRRERPRQAFPNGKSCLKTTGLE